MEKFQVTSSMEVESVEKEEFYEEIEAPNYVDFSTPNHFCPDDRYWFCSRVGCDQKHEEEMNPEAIYKNFVLRVMAARSPNVKFGRAFNRRSPIESKKCPHSAPPKSSKSRIPRLALVSSSISKKLIDAENGKLKLKPPAATVKPAASTPKARVKHVAAKYMTSPRKKKGSSPKLNAFCSVRNPKKTSDLLPKSKVVSKALVFNSPKKSFKKKASEELETPVTTLCEGVKKHQLNTQKKGTVRKPFKECTTEQKKVPSDGSRKIQSSKKRESINAICAKTNTRSGVKSIKAKTTVKRIGDGAVVEVKKDRGECVDMEIDEKSKCEDSDAVYSNAQKTELVSGTYSDSKVTAEKNSVTDEVEIAKERKQEKSSIITDDLENQNSDAVYSNTQKTELVSGKDSDSNVRAEENTVEAEIVKERRQEKSNNTTTDDLDNQNPGVVEVEDNDNKENASNCNNIRNLCNDNKLRKHDAPVKSKVKTKQVPFKMDKTSKENCPAGNGTPGLKNRKLKPTNPKPFRLRTDERGILKEATLERKATSHENASTAGDNSQGIGNGISENREKGSKNDDKPIKIRCKTSNEVELKQERSAGKTKSPFLQKELARTQRKIVSSVIQKTETPAMSKRNESKKQGKEEVADPRKKASVAQKTARQGKRTVTIPREPKFHSLHRTKDGTSNRI